MPRLSTAKTEKQKKSAISAYLRFRALLFVKLPCQVKFVVWQGYCTRETLVKPQKKQQSKLTKKKEE